MNDKDISAPVTKVASAFAAAGVAWSEIASILASVYTLLLIAEWMWKKVGRPYAERRGWVKRRRSRIVLADGTETDHAGL